MEWVCIKPSKLKGTVRVPPSKSICHRAVICGGLSNGRSVIGNVDYSDDINATISGMEALGARVEKNKDSMIIDGSMFLREKNDGAITIECAESGTTLRMLLPISLIKENSAHFTGRGNLGKRPLKPYYDIFDSQGITYKYEKDSLNLYIEGRLKPGDYYLRGDVSSQFISGLLMALPLLDGDSKIIITTHIESKGYVDLTIDMLEKFGICIENIDNNEFIIKGRQSYKPREVTVEGDFSQAALFLAAGALGSCIECEGLRADSLQGDRVILHVLKGMGCEIQAGDKYIKAYSKGTRGALIDGSQIPDIIPVLSVVASLSSGTTKIVNAGRLRTKECDRLNAMHEELSKLGADITELDEGLVIKGRETLKGGIVDGHGDHRVVMALAIASTCCEGPVTIKGSDAVTKSYPGFWSDFKTLGGVII